MQQGVWECLPAPLQGPTTTNLERFAEEDGPAGEPAALITCCVLPHLLPGARPAARGQPPQGRRRRGGGSGGSCRSCSCGHPTQGHQAQEVRAMRSEEAAGSGAQAELLWVLRLSCSGSSVVCGVAQRRQRGRPPAAGYHGCRWPGPSSLSNAMFSESANQRGVRRALVVGEPAALVAGRAALQRGRAGLAASPYETTLFSL